MKNSQKNKKRIVWIATGAAALGAGFGVASVASAATNTGSSSTTAPAVSNVTPSAPADHVDPASMPNGPGETVLTGTDLSSVTAAVKAADPTATIIRAETDSSGHAFEAHVKEADGTVKTYYFTSTYQADGSGTGFGPGGPGGPHGGPQGGPQDQGPQGAPQVPASSSSSATGA